MRTLAGLFNTQFDAERAINDLTRLGIEEGSIRVVNRGTQDNESWLTSIAAAFRAGSNLTSGQLIAAGLPEEEAEFYSRAMDADSALVVVEVDDDHYGEALEIIRNAGGETRDRNQPGVG